MGRPTSLNDIDIERFRRNQTLSLTLKGYGVREQRLPEDQVDEQAECLVAMFGSPQSKAFYCDAVRFLTKAYLDETAKCALKRGRNPARLFTALVYKKLRELGVYK